MLSLEPFTDHLVEVAPRSHGDASRDETSWQRERLWKQARRITWDHLHQALDRLAVAEAGTKGWEYGVEDPDLALELFVASLCAAVGQ